MRILGEVFCKIKRGNGREEALDERVRKENRKQMFVSFSLTRTYDVRRQ